MENPKKPSLSIWNYLENAIIVGFFASCSVLIQGCATGRSSQSLSASLKRINDPGSVTIQLKGQKGDKAATRFYSHSQTKSFHQAQIVKKKDEIVEFTLVETIKHNNTSSDRITVLSTSKDKDGVVSLHDLAFPEKDEVIEYIYTSKGKVLKAGDYPKWSIFYVPPLPLPDGPVQVGDTWEMTEEWRSMNNGIPLQVSLVGILKNVYQCGEDRCADIELSGDVAIANAPAVEIDFISEMHGRLLFNLDKGMNVWSLIQGQEDLRVNEDQTIVVSCLASNLLEPETAQFSMDRSMTKCDPTGQPVTEIP